MDILARVQRCRVFRVFLRPHLKRMSNRKKAKAKQTSNNTFERTKKERKKKKLILSCKLSTLFVSQTIQHLSQRSRYTAFFIPVTIR